MKKLLPLLLALCLTLSACAAPAAVPLPGDSVTAVTVTYAGKIVTCTDPAQVRAMTDAARSLEFVPTDASVTTPGRHIHGADLHGQQRQRRDPDPASDPVRRKSL